MAIQVSGTEVISNARELSNIASVDATTAASITAAGVGGSTVKLIDNVAITTSTLTNFLATYASTYN
jgi:galactokinase